jgi:hypothetical protein
MTLIPNAVHCRLWPSSATVLAKAILFFCLVAGHKDATGQSRVKFREWGINKRQNAILDSANVKNHYGRSDYGSYFMPSIDEIILAEQILGQGRSILVKSIDSVGYRKRFAKYSRQYGGCLNQSGHRVLLINFVENSCPIRSLFRFGPNWLTKFIVYFPSKLDIKDIAQFAKYVDLDNQKEIDDQ